MRLHKRTTRHAHTHAHTQHTRKHKHTQTYTTHHTHRHTHTHTQHTTHVHNTLHTHTHTCTHMYTHTTHTHTHTHTHHSAGDPIGVLSLSDIISKFTNFDWAHSRAYELALDFEQLPEPEPYPVEEQRKKRCTIM
uniref:Uncharacterized protein n=1 Tax=Lotharella globosa TaxID=91324 RepID=A0A7S3YW61_9EUKA